MEVLVKDDAGIDKEKLTKELIDNYRKEVIAYVDIRSLSDKPFSNLVNIRVVGIKK